MRILAFDTTNVVASVGLGGDVRRIEDGRPTELLAPVIEKVLGDNGVDYGDLDLVAVTNGPGSFTTVRIGLSAAKMLALSGVRVASFDSLVVLAHKYRDFKGRVLVVMDARMDEFFVFERGFSGSKKMSLDELRGLDFSGDLLICGSGKDFLRDLAPDAVFADGEDEFSADALLELAQGFEGEDLGANYLRDPKIGVRKA